MYLVRSLQLFELIGAKPLLELSKCPDPFSLVIALSVNYAADTMLHTVDPLTAVTAAI